MRIENGKIIYEKKDILHIEEPKEDLTICTQQDLYKENTYSIEGLIEEARIYGRAVCPICRQEKEALGIFNYEKRNLQINETESFGFCFRCHTVFTDSSKKSFIKLKDFQSKAVFQIDSLDCDFIFNKKNSNAGINFIKQRNPFIDDTFILKYRLICEDNRVIIPFFYQGNCIYYQIRFIKVMPDKPKYFNPVISHKPIYCFNYNPRLDTIFVEGVFDAFALMSVVDPSKYNIVALIGCYISDYQYYLLTVLGGIKKVIIFLDDINKSKDLAKRFRFKGYKGRIEIIKTYHDIDPEELLNQRGKLEFLDYIENFRESYSGSNSFSANIQFLK